MGLCARSRLMRCSSEKQDFTAQRRAIIGLGVPDERILTDYGLNRRNRDRPDLILPRTRDGMRIARDKGKLRGKLPKVVRPAAERLKTHATAEYPISDPGELFNFARPTLCRTIRRGEPAKVSKTSKK